MHRKTPMLGPVFNKVEGLGPATLFKKRLQNIFYRTPSGDCFCKFHHLHKVNDGVGRNSDLHPLIILDNYDAVWRHFPIIKCYF